jgi:RNA polymerase sigma-70 factor (ECF subfamily)
VQEPPGSDSGSDLPDAVDCALGIHVPTCVAHCAFGGARTFPGAAGNQESSFGVPYQEGQKPVSDLRDENILFFPGEIGERALRARLVAGEDAAYRECYQQFAPKLVRMLTSILRNKARAEEVLQETFIAAFRNIASFRGEVSISTWLARIATNRAYNVIRDEARAKRTAPPAEEEPSAGLEPQVEGRDLARKVMAILDMMEPPKKLALLLQAQGYTVAEIAEITSEPRGTILARLSRSRAELSLRMAQADLAADVIAASMEDRS